MKKTRYGCFRTILFAALIFSFCIATLPKISAQASNNWLAGIPASETGSHTLWFPHIAQDDQWWTGIGLLNVGDTFTTVTAWAYDINGNVLGKAAIPLAPGEKKVDTAEGLFSGSLPGGSAWLKVTSSASEITGFELFGTHNGQQLAGIPAFSSGSTTLYFPHIAQNNNWWTGIGLLNIGGAVADIEIIPYDEHGSVAGQALSITLAPGRKLVDTVLNLLGGSLPSGTAWIKVESAGEIIGFELFGTQNGDQLAGIPASGSGAYTLYLPHVASDDRWWTGIGLLNIGNSTASVTVRARKADGNLIKSINFQLAPGEKKVDTAVGLFGGLLPQGTAWLEIISYGSPITAFELFGTHDGLQLAGIPGLSSGSNKLYIPHIAQDDQWCTGIGLVNIGGSNTNVNITAYDTGGSPLGNAPTFPLAPHGNKVDTASGLFGGSLPEGSAWMKVNSSSAPVAGFVLFGSYYLWLYPCPCIAGTWNATETYTVTCIIDGETKTETGSEAQPITIEQNGCNIGWKGKVHGIDCTITGAIEGNNIQVSGIFVSPQSGLTFTQNTFTGEGTISGDEINLSGSGIAAGTFCNESGCYSFSCTGSSTTCMMR